MEDIRQKEYAGFLEETLKALLEMPIEGLCIIGKIQGGDTFINYYKSSVTDKILYAGLIQQDATMDMLNANRPKENED